MNETVYILLPVHNRREITRRFITCLVAQTCQRYHLILIDDGSTDGTAEMVRERVGSLTVITGKGNWWWGGSLHQGYKWLKSRKTDASDVALIMNDDTEFDSRFLETALSVLRDRPRTFLLAECYDRTDNTLIDAGIHVDWKRFVFEQPSSDKPVNCLSTRGLFFRVNDFFSVGGFHPVLLPHYLSDYEFTIRARRKGMHLTTDSSVKVRLDVAATGFHRVEHKGFLAVLRSVFSMRSAINPLALAIFVGLACPWRRKFNSWFRIFSLSLYQTWTLISGKMTAKDQA